jgi:1-deoxy-D-xylulose 5-phosphate reductoisomerase
LKFNEIPRIIENVMNKHKPMDGGLDRYLEAIEWAKEQVKIAV